MASKAASEHGMTETALVNLAVTCFHILTFTGQTAWLLRS
jgi:hypothetical protein